MIAIKAPGFGERKSSYLEDIAILTGAQVVKDELGLSLDKVGEEVLGHAAKIEISKEHCTIVGDGSSEADVKSRVKQIKNLVAETEQDYEKEKLNERIARLSGGVAIIQVCSSTLLDVVGLCQDCLDAAEVPSWDLVLSILTLCPPCLSGPCEPGHCSTRC